MQWLRRAAAEPLIQFLLIGLTLFAFNVWLDGGQGTASGGADRVVVDQAVVGRLEAQFEGVWRRPPTSAERDRLIAEHVREEILVREARALGLDLSDGGVRTRLRQIMEQLLTTPPDGEPDDAILERHLADNAARFEIGERIAFEQRFLGPAPSAEALARVRAAGLSDAVLAELIQPTMLPARLRPSAPQAIDGVFGDGFFADLAEAEPDAWTGPVRSAYGWHAVRVLSRAPARVPTLSEIRPLVLQDWIESERSRSREAAYARMRARYEVVRADTAADPAR